MFDPAAAFIKTEKQHRLYQLAEKHAGSFRRRSAEYDRTGAFPFENFTALKDSGYTRLTVPESLGGEGISVYEFALIEETLATGDGPTALGIGWHLGVVMDLADRSDEWHRETYEGLMDRIVRKKHLINRAATEKQTGSPIRGGRPQTEARREGSNWRISGHKTFTSLAPAADEWIVNAAMKGSEEIGGFLVPRDASGVRFEKTWETIGMRATCSDDLILEDVTLPDHAFVERIGWQDKDHMPPEWLIFIPAVYLGIALAARRDVIDFARSYTPNSLNGPIAELDHVRQKIGEMDSELMKARYLMYGIADQWDRSTCDERRKMGADLQAVKYTATHTAIRVVQLAMRVVGGSSLFRSRPFERYYRDVCAGLFNPPSDDGILTAVGKRSLE